MKYKIGVFGSSSGTGAEAMEAARQVGRALATHSEDVIVVTGGCSSLPYAAAHQAAQGGVDVWGFSPVFTMEEQKEYTPDDDLSIYAKLQFIPTDFPYADNRRICMKYRNVLTTATCDAGIIIAGRWGSMGEFTNLIDMQKVVGVLTGTGGVADELPALCKKIVKEGQGTVFFNDDPVKLLDEVLDHLQAATAKP